MRPTRQLLNSSCIAPAIWLAFTSSVDCKRQAHSFCNRFPGAKPSVEARLSMLIAMLEVAAALMILVDYQEARGCALP